MGRRGKVLRALVAALALAAVVATVTLVLSLLPRDDVPAEPDAVVVLGGGGGDRAALGISLADRYDVPLVLSSSAAVFGERQGRRCGQDAICFDPVPETTAGEARNMSTMADEEGWEHIVVATSSFHTSRSRWLFRQCFGDDRVSVVGSTRAGHPDTTPGLILHEALGVIAGTTFARAC